MNDRNINSRGGRIKFILTFCLIAILFFAVTKTNPFSRNLKTLAEDQTGILTETSEYGNAKDILRYKSPKDTVNKNSISDSMNSTGKDSISGKKDAIENDNITGKNDVDENDIIFNEDSTVAKDGEADKGVHYEFASRQKMMDHFNKHGSEFDYKTVEEYVEGANAVINNMDSLHKYEKEDGDDVYYLEATNEFVVVSKGGYIRTYFKPNKGLDYFNRQ